MEPTDRSSHVLRAARAVLCALAAGWLVLLAACEPPPPQLSSDAAARAGQLDEYRLGPGDKLAIRVFGQQDLSGDFEISPTGQLSMPLLGQVEAANQTLADVQRTIVSKLADKYLVNPQVAIQVVNYRPFYILGQVNKPGAYPYQAGLNVRQAVAIAGGFTRRAREDAVNIIRNGGDGKEQQVEVPVNAAVLPGDSIDVGRRLF